MGTDWKHSVDDTMYRDEMELLIDHYRQMVSAFLLDPKDLTNFFTKAELHVIRDNLVHAFPKK